MKATNLTIFQTVKNPQFWLLGIAAGFIAIHLSLIWKADVRGFPDMSNLLAISGLFWASVCSQIWERRHNLNLESGILPSFLGLLIFTALLARSASLGFGFYLYFFPFFFALGLALIASGFQGLKLYKREIIILFVLGAPKLLSVINLSPITAKFATFILWYTNFDVNRSGVNIYLPGGAVEVYPGCSGIELISHMLRLAILLMFIIPQNRQQKILLLIVAVIVGFIVNGVRVALMAILVAQGNLKTFQYWHDNQGSLVFSLIAVLIFGIFCWYLIGRDDEKHQKV